VSDNSAAPPPPPPPLSDEAIARIPYARFLGLRLHSHEDGQPPVLVMPFSAHLIGNPMLPALHGGTSAAFMELTAFITLALQEPRAHLPRPINVTIAYLRSGRALDTFARARTSKVGKRIAHVEVEAWQRDEAEPIARLQAHFMLAETTNTT
jgi:uncharacterized protein (TIGR00369 family)